MRLLDTELLRMLGEGQRIATICDSAGIDRTEFDQWWRRVLDSRAAPNSGTRCAAVGEAVEIMRDKKGIPHIFAESDRDLFYGLGYAMAQDRLFQLDYLRRKGTGCLSAVLGRATIHQDRVARTVGLNRIAEAEWRDLDDQVRCVLEAFAAGVNSVIEESVDSLPIEFDLLGYRPEPWTPIDSLAIENEFRWYLTGRFPIIVIPELVKRALGEGALYRDCILGESDDEAILQQDEYRASDSGRQFEPVGESVADPDAAIGSNNWVIAPDRSTTGNSLLASDPHIAFEAVSCWYESHLCGGSYNVAGMAYVGIPAILVGRNERLTWGITNNICSQRDLYQERTHPDHPGCFEYDGQWEAAREIAEVIDVRNEDPEIETICFSRNGPIVDEILPDVAKDTGPVALKWLGAHQGGWLSALLAIGRSESVTECRKAAEPWHVPTFSLVMADVEGHIGYQSTGRIPIRKHYERAYRPGWDPEHQWQGLIPFDEMPGVVDPERGWIATANNRVAADDFPHQLFGCWASGWRAQRIRQMIEQQTKLSPDEMRQMQRDTVSLRASTCVPTLLAVLDEASEPGADHDTTMEEAVSELRRWNYESSQGSIGASIFNVFFAEWCKTVANERLEGPTADLVAPSLAGCASRLLSADPHGWFAKGDRSTKIDAAFKSALENLASRCGPRVEAWVWGRLHVMPLQHVLAGRGDLGQLLNHGGRAVDGDMTTVANTGCEPDFRATAGSGYRMVADLASSPPVLSAVDAQSQSGQAGTQHYDDQLVDWEIGNYHAIPLDIEGARAAAVTTRTLVPIEA